MVRLSRRARNWESTLADLQVNLNTRRYKTLPLGDPGVKFTSNATEWMSIGRPMAIDGSRQLED